ncbi:Uma2 family endonuclease, partial [Lentzea sp. BCCO 10_0856]
MIDGTLVFRLWPQRQWHSRIVTRLTLTLLSQVPSGRDVEREMTIRLDERNRPEPDLLVSTATYDRNRTWFEPADV